MYCICRISTFLLLDWLCLYLLKTRYFSSKTIISFLWNNWHLHYYYFLLLLLFSCYIFLLESHKLSGNIKAFVLFHGRLSQSSDDIYNGLTIVSHQHGAFQPQNIQFLNFNLMDKNVLFGGFLFCFSLLKILLVFFCFFVNLLRFVGSLEFFYYFFLMNT